MRTLFLIAVLALAGCGSGGGGTPSPLPAPVVNGTGSAVWNAVTPDRITIPCADVNPDLGEPCNAPLSSDIGPLGPIWNSGIFNSGTFQISDWTYYQLTIANGHDTPRRICIDLKSHACPAGGGSTSIPNMEIPANMAFKHWDTGGMNFEVCALPGLANIEVHIYNGEGYPLGVSCDGMPDVTFASIVWLYSSP